MEQGRIVDPGEVDPDPYPNLTFNGKTTGVNPDLTVKKKLGSGFNHRKTLGSDRIRILNPDYNQALLQRTQIPSYGLICGPVFGITTIYTVHKAQKLNKMPK